MADQDDTKTQPGTPPAGSDSTKQGMSPPGSTKGTSGPTPGQDKDKGDDEPEFTKAQVTDLIQREVGKLTRKYSKERETLEAELNQLRDAKLTAPEKQQAEIAKLEKSNTEKDIQLAELTLKTKKREMLETRLAAGKMAVPAGKTVADLLKLVTGNEDEDIAASLDFVESLFPVVPTKNIGTGTKPGSTTTTDKIWTKAEVLKLQKENPLEYEKNRAAILQQMGEGLIK